MFKVGDKVRLIGRVDLFGWTDGLIVGEVYTIVDCDYLIKTVRLQIGKKYHKSGAWWIPVDCVESVLKVNEQLLLFGVV